MVFVRFEILTVVLLCDVLLVEQFMTFQKIVGPASLGQRSPLFIEFDHDPSQQA